MDKRKARRLDQIGDGSGLGAEVEEVEEEDWWEGRKRTTINGHCTGRGGDD